MGPRSAVGACRFWRHLLHDRSRLRHRSRNVFAVRRTPTQDDWIMQAGPRGPRRCRRRRKGKPRGDRKLDATSPGVRPGGAVSPTGRLVDASARSRRVSTTEVLLKERTTLSVQSAARVDFCRRLPVRPGLAKDLRFPGVGILLILQLQSRPRKLQRSERIDHHGELVRAFLPDRAFVSARMRSVRDATRMERKRAPFDPLSTHELSLRIKENLIRIDIGVIVRCRNGKGMIVEFPRHEGTYQIG